MICPNCQFTNPKSEKYCLNCGEPLKVTAESVQPTIPVLGWIALPFLAVFLILASLFLFGIIDLPQAAPGAPSEPFGSQPAEAVGHSLFDAISITATSDSSAAAETPISEYLPTAEPLVAEDYATFTPTVEDSKPQGKIVFTCQVDRTMNHDQICVINADGSNWRQLTNDLKYQHYYASFSRDGSEIVFSSSLPDRKGFNIFMMDSDGSNLKQLTSGMGDFYAPALSPDGKYIIATRHKNKSNSIVLLTREGKLVKVLNDYHDCKDPVWSPDGSEILFAANPGKTDIQIYVMNNDGSNVRKLTNMKGLRGRVDWGTDGVMASYAGEYSRQDREIFLFSKERDPHFITEGGDNLAPSFSPDGKWITFMSYRDNFWDPDGCEIYIMRLADGYTHRLTNNNYCDYQPRWAP